MERQSTPKPKAINKEKTNNTLLNRHDRTTNAGVYSDAKDFESNEVSNSQSHSSFDHDLSSVPVGIQTKLRIGDVNDKYEQEADRVAEQVMRMPESGINSLNNVSSVSNSIQRKCSSCEEEELVQRKVSQSRNSEISSDLSSQISSLAGSGRAMSESERSFFEPRFGTDFSNVRIHDNNKANGMARSISARAFTIGNNIVFGSGQYSSGSFASKKLFAHELTHVVQQSHNLQQRTKMTGRTQNNVTGAQAKPLVVQRHINRDVLQCDLLDAVQQLGSRNPVLTNWVFELGTAFEFLRNLAGSLTSTGARRVRAVERALARMQEQNYSEESLVRWMQAIFATLGSLTARSPWMSDQQHERLLEASRAVQSASRLSIPSLSSAADQLARERHQRRHQSEVNRLTGRLRRYIRRNWTRIRTAPRFQWIAIERLMRRTLTTDEQFSDYLSGIAETNSRLHQFLSLLQRNPDSIQRNQNDIFRTMVLSVGGEWADLVEQTDDQRLASELTGDTETSLEAEVAGTVIDTAITTLPILDQIGDVRDFGAHLYALLNVSGRHANEATSPMRWLGVVLSGIGAIPVIGSVMKGTGRIIVRILRRLGNGVSGIVSRAVEPVIGLVRRNLPNAIPFFQRLLRRASDSWGSVVSTVTRKWDEVADALSTRLDNVLLRATAFGRRLRGRWLWVRSTASEKISEALAILQRLFAPVYRGVLSALQRGGRVAARLIPSGLLSRANRMLERVTSLLGIAGRRISRLRQRITTTASNLVDRFSTPTMRLERLNRQMGRLDDVQSRLQAAIDIGDSEAVELLYREAGQLANDIERRLGQSAGAHVTDVEEVTEAATSTHVPTSSVVPDPTDTPTRLPPPPRIPREHAPTVPAEAPPPRVPREFDDTIPVETPSAQRAETNSVVQNNQHAIDDTNSGLSEISGREPTRSERIRSEQEPLQELAGNEQALRPVDDPDLLESGYELEVELEDGVIYRRRNDGVWCRFNSPSDCNTPVPSALEERAQNIFADLTEEEIDDSLDGFDELISDNDLTEFRPARGHATAVAFDNIDRETMSHLLGLDDSQMNATWRLLSGHAFNDDMQSVFHAASRSSDLVVARTNLSARVLSELEETIRVGEASQVASELRRLATSILGDSAGHQRGRIFSPLTRDAEILRRRMQRLAFEIELNGGDFTGALMQQRVRRMFGSYRRNIFGSMRERFYRLIGGNPRALRGLTRAEFESANRLRREFGRAGLVVPGNGSAPYWSLSRDRFVNYLQQQGVITGSPDFSQPMWRWLENNNWRIPLSIEHIDRLSDNPAIGLDPMNFLFTMLRENSVVLERIRRRGRNAGL